MPPLCSFGIAPLHCQLGDFGVLECDPVVAVADFLDIAGELGYFAQPVKLLRIDRDRLKTFAETPRIIVGVEQVESAGLWESHACASN